MASHTEAPALLWVNAFSSQSDSAHHMQNLQPINRKGSLGLRLWIGSGFHWNWQVLGALAAIYQGCSCARFPSASVFPLHQLQSRLDEIGPSEIRQESWNFSSEGVEEKENQKLLLHPWIK